MDSFSFTPTMRTDQDDVMNAARRVLNALRKITNADPKTSARITDVFKAADLKALPMEDTKFQDDVIRLLEGKTPVSADVLVVRNGDSLSITSAGNERCVTGPAEWKANSNETIVGDIIDRTG